MAVNIVTDGQTGDVYFTPYKSYIFILTNTGTGAPVVTVMNAADSNFLPNITWSRTLAGIYSANCSDGYPANKTIAFLTTDTQNVFASAFIGLTDIDVISAGADGNRYDLDGAVFYGEIRVYS